MLSECPEFMVGLEYLKRLSRNVFHHVYRWKSYVWRVSFSSLSDTLVRLEMFSVRFRRKQSQRVTDCSRMSGSPARRIGLYSSHKSIYFPWPEETYNRRIPVRVWMSEFLSFFTVFLNFSFFISILLLFYKILVQAKRKNAQLYSIVDVTSLTIRDC